MFEEEITPGVHLKYVEENGTKRLQFICPNTDILEREFGTNTLYGTTSTSKFVSDFMTLSEERLGAFVDTKKFKAAFRIAFDNLRNKHTQYMNEIKEAETLKDLGKDEESTQKRMEMAAEFEDLLHEYDLSFIEYIFYVADWLVAGETNNIVGAFIAYLTVVFGLKPAWVSINGVAGGGKTTIEEAALSLIPDKNKVPGNMTYASLFDLTLLYGEFYFDKKIACLGDMGGLNDLERLSEVINVFKELDGASSPQPRIKEIKNEDGIMVPTAIYIRGKSSISLTSVHEFTDTQLISRAMMFTPNGSEDSFNRFKDSLSMRNSTNFRRNNIIENEIPLLKAYIEERAESEDFKPEFVINPYYRNLRLWTSKSDSARRSLGFMEDMVKIITLLHKDERQTVTGVDPDGTVQTYYISSKFDNRIVSHIFSLYAGLSQEAINFYNWVITKVDPFVEADGWIEYDDHGSPKNEIWKLDEKEIKMNDAKQIFTVGSIKRKCSQTIRLFQRSKVGDYCYALRESGLLDTVESSKFHQGNMNWYILSEDLDHKPIGKGEMKIDEQIMQQYCAQTLFGNDGNFVPGIDENDFWNKVNMDSNSDINISESLLPPWSLVKKW